jgi:hypothetical protein
MSNDSDADLLARLKLEPVQDAAAKAALERAIAQAPTQTRRVGGPFVVIEIAQLKLAIAAVSDLGVPALVVWLCVVFETRRRQTNTVPLSNAMLKVWGVSRKAKYKALDRFEEANLISVRRSGNRSPLVTLKTCPFNGQQRVS